STDLQSGSRIPCPRYRGRTRSLSRHPRSENPLGMGLPPPGEAGPCGTAPVCILLRCSSRWKSLFPPGWGSPRTATDGRADTGSLRLRESDKYRCASPCWSGSQRRNSFFFCIVKGEKLLETCVAHRRPDLGCNAAESRFPARSRHLPINQQEKAETC